MEIEHESRKLRYRGSVPGNPEVLWLCLCWGAADELAVEGEDLLLHLLRLHGHEPELRHEGGRVQITIKIPKLR